MYRIPANLDLHDIIGSEIYEIGWGKYHIIFNFYSKRNITVESLIELWNEGKVLTTWAQNEQWSNHLVQNILQVKVTSYQVESDTVLAIHFENGYTLRIYDNSDQYESFEIGPGPII